MYPVSAGFLAALRSSHSVTSRVEVWTSGVLTGTLSPTGGQVRVTSGDGVRRTLDFTAAPEPGVSDLLTPYGTLLKPYRGIRFLPGTVEEVPLGVFRLDGCKTSLTGAGEIAVTAAPDQWAVIQAAKFETPQVSEGGGLVTTATSLADTAFTAPPAHVITATATASHKEIVWDRDRDKAIGDLAEAGAFEVFFDHTGRLVIRDLPSDTDPPVWFVSDGDAGILETATLELNSAGTCNVVVVTAADVSGTAPFDPVIVADTDPASATRVTGPFGRRAWFVSNPLIEDETQALTAGTAELSRRRQATSRLTLSGVVNPALDAGDVIDIRAGTNVETHLISTVTIPMTAEGAQVIETRATGPEQT